MANQFVQLKDGSDNLFPKTRFIVPDTSNVIASGSVGGGASISYTATQDCFVRARGGNGNAMWANIGGERMWSLSSQNTSNPPNFYFSVLKGQTINVGNTSSSSTGSYAVYGMKYN